LSMQLSANHGFRVSELSSLVLAAPRETWTDVTRSRD
jgi:hypothetical protein